MIPTLSPFTVKRLKTIAKRRPEKPLQNELPAQTRALSKVNERRHSCRYQESRGIGPSPGCPNVQ
jgi:hypothetical protein